MRGAADVDRHVAYDLVPDDRRRKPATKDQSAPA
jgi:hypothetical protein